MLRICLSLLMFAFASAMAWGETIVADSLYVFDPGKPLSEALYHLRIKPDKYNSISLSFYWNYTDSAHYGRAALTIPPVVDLDNTDAVEITCNIFRRDGHGEKVIGTACEPVTFSRGRDAAFSIILHANHSGSRLCFGDRHENRGIEIDSKPLMPGAYAFRTDRDARLITHTLISRSQESVRHFEGDVSANIDDPITGIWGYLDRDSDPAKVAGGIDYNIAVVADTDGSYTIVYQGDDNGIWRKGDIKGRLLPTPFVNHYDLEWHDASGRLHKRDTSADLMVEGEILRLNFPLLSTSLRLRRIRPQ